MHYIRRAAAAKGATLQNIYSVIPFVVKTTVTPLHQVDPSIPAHTGRIIDRCMAKSPDQRFDSMKDVAAALRQSLERFLGVAGSGSSVALPRSVPSVHSRSAPEAKRASPRPICATTQARVRPPPRRPRPKPFTHSPFFGAASVAHSGRPGSYRFASSSSPSRSRRRTIPAGNRRLHRPAPYGSAERSPEYPRQPGSHFAPERDPAARKR